MSAEQTHVIAGASLAGAKAAEALRAEGFDGRIVLIGAETDRPYERPELSKGYLRGEKSRDAVYVHSEGFYDEQRIELRTGTYVSEVDARASAVVLSDGEELSYDRLLLATGAEPRRLSVPGVDLDGVHTLRTVEDSDALRSRLEAGGHAVVIGGGWIGMEVAASARQRGLDVTVIEPLELPLLRALGPELGRVYRDVHVDHGVRMLTETGVQAIEGSGRAERVRTTTGETIDCSFVVVGVGVAPRLALAESAGVAIDNGVLVDESLTTSVANIHAAGDVANAQHPFYGERIRVEHWANALNQGKAVAQSMLGRPLSYDRVPYFYSDQYDVGMEYSGHAAHADAVVIRGDLDRRAFIAFWLQEGRVVAGMNVNVWDVVEDIQALIRSRAVVDRQRLADTDVPLGELVSAVA